MYTIVLVADEFWNLKGMEQIVSWEEYGFTVAFSTTKPMEALAFIKSTPPDAILTDIRMPHMTGLQLIHEVNLMGIDAEFIIMSGYGEFSYAQEAIQEGVAEYFLRPVKKEALIALLYKLKEKIAKKERNLLPKSFDAESPDMVEPENLQFKKMIVYIQAHFQENLMLKDLAAMFFLNENYCCFLFKKHMNTTFSKYMNYLRIEKAKQFLQKGSATLTEIAEEIGYNNYFYFLKMFKRITGHTPKNYRLLNKKERDST